MAKAKDIHWNGRISSKDIEIPQEIFDKVQAMGEELLRSHIETDIYGVDRRGAGTWLLHDQYERRHELPGSVHSYREGDVVWVTADAKADPPILGHKYFVSAESGAFLAMLDKGNLGFLTKRTRYAPSFPRPALRNAQREADSAAFKSRIQKLFDDYYN